MRNVRANRQRGLRNTARNYNITTVHFLGNMSQICEHCSGLKFQDELFKCCHGGKVSLPDISEYPDELRELMTGNTVLCRNFQNNIRKYNNSFAFAFLGDNIRPPPGQGPPCFRISGQLFHRSGCLHPADNVAPTFNQLYITDVADAVNFRLNNPANDGCLEEIFQIISNVMQRMSPFSMAYKSTRQIEIEEQQRADQENSTICCHNEIYCLTRS